LGSWLDFTSQPLGFDTYRILATHNHVSARLMNAMYFGVPQSRERMIFIGVREDLC
jgi:site-specific DNA-cytosine methylase